MIESARAATGARGSGRLLRPTICGGRLCFTHARCLGASVVANLERIFAGEIHLINPKREIIGERRRHQRSTT